MIKSREQIKAAAIAASIKEREKGKKKKHPPNNNGPREKYNKGGNAEGEGLLAEIAPASVPVRVERTEEKAAPKPAAEAPAAAAPAPVVAPSPAPPIKRTKPKVVKF
jgi:hypothetical protein